MKKVIFIMPIANQTCTSCKCTKPVDAFYKRNNRPSGRQTHSECKDCLKARASKRYHSDPERVLDMQQCRLYGITMDELAAMRKEANGICQACERPGEGNYKRLVIDHDHKTGKVRGLICQKCNTVLGLVNDNINTLENLAQFITEHNA